MVDPIYIIKELVLTQTMFKILRLRRQRCQIKRITGLPKTWGQERERKRERERERERELKIKIRGGGRGGGTLAMHG
jgi:hypothetical protein